jgi:hypothetical protein
MNSEAKDIEAISDLLPPDEREDLAVNKVADVTLRKPTDTAGFESGLVCSLPCSAFSFPYCRIARRPPIERSRFIVHFPKAAASLSYLCLDHARDVLSISFDRTRWLVLRIVFFAEEYRERRSASDFVRRDDAAFQFTLPERGLPFWIVAFCFFWTLWNNLFADFDTKKLLRSLGALFGLAFVVKYLVLANLAAPDGRSWFERLTENPGQEAMTWLLDLPRFLGRHRLYQFFAAALFLIGLYLLPASTNDRDRIYEI